MSTEPQIKSGAVLRGVPSISAYAPPRILKSDAATASELLQEAQSIRSQARVEADELIRSARAETERMIAEAEQEARRLAGIAEEDVRRAFQERAAAVFASIEAELAGLVDDMALHAQRSAWQIARSVLKIEFAVNPDRIVELVASTIREAKLYESITVIVNAEDYELLAPHAAALRSFAAMAGSFELRPDANLSRGSVRIDTEMGGFDGGLATRLDRLQAHATARKGGPS